MVVFFTTHHASQARPTPATPFIIRTPTPDFALVTPPLPPQVTFDALQTLSVTFGAMILIAIANPPVIPVFLPIAFVFVRIRRYYLVTSREVKRFEAVTRSPVYAMFSTTLKGLPTIRAFGVEARFRRRFLDLLDLNGAWWMAYIATARCVPVLCVLCEARPVLVAALPLSVFTRSMRRLRVPHACRT